jgi:uncharacterized protein
MLDARLLDILACPLCKSPLSFDRANDVLLCRGERLEFPIRDGVPILLDGEARPLPADDPRLSA